MCEKEQIFVSYGANIFQIDWNSQKIVESFHGHTAAVTACCHAFFNSTIVTGSQDKTVKLFDVRVKRGAAAVTNLRYSNSNPMTYNANGEIVKTIATRTFHGPETAIREVQSDPFKIIACSKDRVCVAFLNYSFDKIFLNLCFLNLDLCVGCKKWETFGRIYRK